MKPFLSINIGGSTLGYRPNSQKIVEAISKQIRDSSSFGGCRLPPVRVLAHQLGVSKNTIQTVYEELKSQGLVESQSRRGLFVSHSDAQIIVAGAKQVPPIPLRKIPAPLVYKRPRGDKKSSIQLSSVFIDPDLLPKKKLAECFRSVLKSPGLPDFSELQGFLPLREKIAERLRKRGIQAHSDHILITCGSQHALDLVSRTAESRVIATENPAYYVGKALLEMNGKTVVGLPIAPLGSIDMTAWEAVIKTHRPGLLYLTSNYQNPTGYSYSSRELMQLLEWSQKYKFGILEDDWGSEMLSYSEFRPSLRTLGGNNVFYMNSFTKKLLPSIRLGYLLSNESSIKDLLNAKRLSTIGVPGIMEVVLFEFLDRGYYDQHLKDVQKELDRRYESTLEVLRTVMPPGVQWTTPGGGPSVWLELPKQVSVQKIKGELAEKKIFIQPADDAFIGTPHLNGFKIGYANLKTHEMEKALELLALHVKNQL